ncbi:MAG: HepT-like ribonuclease domain-containing protein, partial [Roseiflexus sp.]
VERYTAGQTYDSFAANDLLLDATVRNLEIIGEAARPIPDEIRQQYSAVNWSQIVGFRNIVIHKYFDVDPEIVWDIATSRLKTLKSVVEQIRQNLKED